MSDEFEIHPGPILAGDFLVIEINGQLLKKPANTDAPQWFVARASQNGAESIPLKPIDECKFYKPRKYIAAWNG